MAQTDPSRITTAQRAWLVLLVVEALLIVANVLTYRTALRRQGVGPLEGALRWFTGVWIVALILLLLLLASAERGRRSALLVLCVLVAGAAALANCLQLWMARGAV
jgi:hypothetical protein